MSKHPEFVESTETLSLIVNARQSKVSTSDLIKYLSNYEQLVKTLNFILNAKYCVGYDIVQIDIEGLKEGSFEIKTKIKKFSEKTLEILFGIFLTKMLTNDPAPIVLNINGDNVTVNVSDINTDKRIIRHRSRLARTANEDEEVDGLTVDLERPNGEREKVKITRDMLGGIIVDDEDLSESESSWLHNATMVIVSPVLESEPASWRVRIGDRKFSAKMTDEAFLASMNKEKIAFGKGDTIVADLETIITKNEGSAPTTKNYIRKVHSYPKYPQVKGQTLFDEIQ